MKKTSVFPLALFAICLFTAAGTLAGLFDTVPPNSSAPRLTPVEHQRGTEQTFLTFPEWFLVHSPAEYANYVRHKTPSDFPFIGHIRQFWQSYARVYRASSEGYSFNFGYHVMIMVIGTSTTVEYGIRAAYETLIGRLSEATQSSGLTSEDRYGAKVAQEYVDFIRIKPWYEFDFMASLKGLWADTAFAGPDMIRKWERKYALTTEYAAKAIYGWIIMQATRAGYDEAGNTTVVVLDRLPADAASGLPLLKVLKPLAGGRVLVSLPRYQAFSTYAVTLAKQGANFVEIAGNPGPILISVLTTAPPATSWPDARILFEQPIITVPGRRRVALVASVTSLAKLLNTLDAGGIELEHIYDY